MSVIVLIGFMGAGKTTVGRRLARELGVTFVDSDQHIEAQHSRTVREIFATDGEEEFRRLEHATVAELAAGADTVLAVGGGAAEHPQMKHVVRNAIVVYLHVNYGVALSRVGGDGQRPMLQRRELAEVYRRRLIAYADLATVTINTDGRRPRQVVQEILAALPRT